MKKKASIIILTAILIASFYNEIYSQAAYRFNPNHNKVIAANGLNMRSKPNTKSTKLVNIPYGEKVHIIHKDHYGMDTVYTIKTETQEHAVYGYWQKVQYKEYSGYVHSAFLTYSQHNWDKAVPNINEDYVLLMPGYHCASPIYNANEYFWYGFYQEQVGYGEEAKKPYRKMIEVEFINVPDEYSGMGTIVKEDKDLRFIIGTKKILNEGHLENILERQFFNYIDQENIELDSTIAAEGKLSIVKNEEPIHGYFDTEFFYLTEGKTTQLLNPMSQKYRIKMRQSFIQGDFDGDGKPDYIFGHVEDCLLYTSPSPRDQTGSRMPSSA